MLELKDARKHYVAPGGEVAAVDGVSLRVEAGERIALFGPSGSGKTTLLQIAAGLLQLDSGQVLFQGRDLSRMSKSEIREHRRTQLGFVFQDFKLMQGLSAAENVAIPLLLAHAKHTEAHKRAIEALDGVGLSARAEHSPGQLSGGEQQRVSIARALIASPRLILADEPTGNLDSSTGDAVLGLLSSLPQKHGAALVLVTHDVRVAGYADRVLAMRDGKLVDFDPQPFPVSG